MTLLRKSLKDFLAHELGSPRPPAAGTQSLRQERRFRWWSVLRKNLLPEPPPGRASRSHSAVHVCRPLTLRAQ